MNPAEQDQDLAATLADLAAGKAVLVVDDLARPSRGELCVAGDLTTADHVGFMAVHARGLVCLAMVPGAFRRLGIPLMPADRGPEGGIAYGISFEAREGVSTGISAADRAETIRVAVDSRSGPGLSLIHI